MCSHMQIVFLIGAHENRQVEFSIKICSSRRESCVIHARPSDPKTSNADDKRNKWPPNILQRLKNQNTL